MSVGIWATVIDRVAAGVAMRVGALVVGSCVGTNVAVSVEEAEVSAKVVGVDSGVPWGRGVGMMFARGSSYTQIAEARGNSTVTVRNSIYRIQNKLGVDTKQEMVVWAVKNGLLDDVERDG